MQEERLTTERLPLIRNRSLCHERTDVNSPFSCLGRCLKAAIAYWQSSISLAAYGVRRESAQKIQPLKGEGGSMAERSKALDLGSSLSGGVGSNPTAANLSPEDHCSVICGALDSFPLHRATKVNCEELAELLQDPHRVNGPLRIDSWYLKLGKSSSSSTRMDIGPDPGKLTGSLAWSSYRLRIGCRLMPKALLYVS